MVVPDIAGGGGGGGGGESFCQLFSSSHDLPRSIEEPRNAYTEVENVKAKPIDKVAIKREQTTATPPTEPDNDCTGNDGDDGGGRCCSSSPSSPLMKSLATARDEAVLQIKEEKEIEVLDCDHVNGGGDGGDCLGVDDNGDNVNNGNGSCSSSSSDVLPKPMEGLNDLGPPPFLKKTFEMVEDPETDPIVSWSLTRDSFIVWDSHKFSERLLPKFFKHKNFSSFIRQLNTYGFRKIDSDRWEFANKGFQGGKKHLLKNIKRRSRYNKQLESAMSGSNSVTVGLEAEVETMKNDQTTLKMEIMKLRQQQEESQHQLRAVEERMLFAECKQHHMLNFFARVAKDPKFVQRLIQKRKLQRELDGVEYGKKPRLLDTQASKSLPEAVDARQYANCRNYTLEQLDTTQSELVGVLSESMITSPGQELLSVPTGDESGSRTQDDGEDVMCGRSTSVTPSVYHEIFENLMEEAAIRENVVNEEMTVNDCKIYLELEDLLEKPQNWLGCIGGLV